MKIARLLAALAAWTALVVAPGVRADAPDATSVTLGRHDVSLPVPEDFADPSSVPPEQHVLAERLTPPNNRLLALMLTKDYLAQRAAGDKPHMSRYLLVQTIRAAEDSAIDAALFEQLKAQLRQNADAWLAKARDTAKPQADAAIHEVGKQVGDPAVSVEMGAMKSLGIFDEHPDSIALATVQPIAATTSAGQHAFNQVMAFGIVLVDRRPVLAALYSDYDSQADIDWAEQRMRAWIARVRELNP